MIFSIHTTYASCKGFLRIYLANRGHASPFILSSCGLAVLGGGHGILVAEEAVEGAAVGDAALLGDETHGIVGGGKQVGGMTDAVVVDELGKGNYVKTKNPCRKSR